MKFRKASHVGLAVLLVVLAGPLLEALIPGFSLLSPALIAKPGADRGKSFRNRLRTVVPYSFRGNDQSVGRTGDFGQSLW